MAGNENTLVNCCICDSNCEETIVCWKIFCVKDEQLTVQGLYDMVLSSSEEMNLHLSDHFLERCKVGISPENLYSVDGFRMKVKQLVAIFGHFVKFYINKTILNEGESSFTNTNRTNAFVMVEAQKCISTKTIPELKIPRNKKDELFNALIKFIEKSEFKWTSSEISSNMGLSTISILTDVLWYIDGHYEKFAERYCGIPKVFYQFTNFNKPERFKHKKRQVSSLSVDTLSSHSQRLFGNLQSGFWNHPEWKPFKQEVEMLAQGLQKYCNIIKSKRSQVFINHHTIEQVRCISNSLNIMYIPARLTPSEDITDLSYIVNSGEIDKIYLLEELDLLSNDRRRRYEYIEEVKKGLTVPTILVTYSPGSNLCNLQWIWHTSALDINSALHSSQPLIESIKLQIPKYHSRAMRKAAFEKYGLITPSVKKSVLRHMYKDLAGDVSAADTLSQAEVDKRVDLFFELEDPDLIYDFRELYAGRHTQFDTFWAKAKEFLEEDIGTAVDDRRHSQVVHLAKAVSVRDFRDQVAAKLSDDTPIPSKSYIQLQFMPARKETKTSQRYTGILNVKRMVQQRQWRKQHPDSHYAACNFRYQREFALKTRDVSILVCADDKHRIKVGEPSCPVASVERGCQVLVQGKTLFQVSDHDFTRFSMIPSVLLVVDIPEKISESWYDGQVNVTYKDSAFEPSSPIRHASELANIISETAKIKPVLFIYSDGGPDHRVTYMSVKLSMISLFLFLDLDYLCAARTAPYHSYRNPAERVMSILNMGLQSVGVARNIMVDSNEKAIKSCNSIAKIRIIAEKNNLRENLLDSIEPVKILLSKITERLQLKEKKFNVTQSASKDLQTEVWSCLNKLDSEFNLSYSEKINLKCLTPRLNQFLTHCCRQRHYFFKIRKCGSPECEICCRLRLSTEEFSKIKLFPDPVIKDDGHFKSFEDVHGTETSENDRPSLKKAKGSSLPFYASVQHAKNSGMMLCCDECGMWRVIYASRKLKTDERQLLECALDGLCFSCGSLLQDAELPEGLQDVVFVRSMNCGEPVEPLYYSANYVDICVYCSADLPIATQKQEHFPQCDECYSQPNIPRRTTKKQ